MKTFINQSILPSVRNVKNLKNQGSFQFFNFFFLNHPEFYTFLYTRVVVLYKEIATETPTEEGGGPNFYVN